MESAGLEVPERRSGLPQRGRETNVLWMSQIDWELLDAIADGYDAEFLEIFRELETTTPGLYDQLEAELSSGDFEKASRTAHQIKGCVANFGFADLAETMREIEYGGREGHAEGLLEKCRDGRSQFSAAIAEVKAQRDLA